MENVRKTAENLNHKMTVFWDVAPTFQRFLLHPSSEQPAKGRHSQRGHYNFLPRNRKMNTFYALTTEIPAVEQLTVANLLHFAYREMR
jgi:hypothetical protein